MAASRLRALVFLLPAVLCAGQGVVDIKTPALPVNGTVGHSAWLPVEINPIPEKAEITWKFTEIGRAASIARLDTSDGKIKIFEDTVFDGRVTVHENVTLQIDNLTMDDGGTYTVTLAGGGRDYTGKVTLQVYEPVSVPTVELIENITAENCNVTLLCSVEMGSNISYTWTSLGTTQKDGEVEQLSGNTGELKLSVGMSDPIHYRCTVWNAVSEESREIRVGPPCTQSQKGSLPVGGLNIDLRIVVPIIIIIVIIIVIIITIRFKCQKSRTKNREEQTQSDQPFTRVPTIPNNYVSTDLVVFNPAAHTKVPAKIPGSAARWGVSRPYPALRR
ncbi:SLAM family member 6-like [Hemiscyllium ocellatum]|uniref:SLAM family member 6-like n=1 Tax=Hemiscyllium ocellatum TaxID=170820 RepID=UPI0029675C2C|nr:SLAM family member 6-like [Hemiscyllium ocellatum]